MRNLISASLLGLSLSLPLVVQGEVKIAPEELQDIARDAYIYAYPLVLMQLTREVGTNVSQPTGLRAPLNQLAHGRAFPDEKFTDVVRPNADTLYSVLSFDVSQEPLVLHVPDSQGRYYMLTLQDWWTDVFAAPGTRTSGSGEQTLAIVGPNWHGTLPAGVRLYRSPTNDGMMIGRTRTNGKADYASVHQFQDGIQAYPLSAYGKTYTAAQGKVDPQLDMRAPPVQVEAMSAAQFFKRFGQLLANNPPHATDYPILDRMQRLGLKVGEPFDLSKLSSAVQQALNDAPQQALPMIKSAFRNSGVQANGWQTNLTAIGTYGSDYLHRAGVAYAGLGANVIEDAIYPTAYSDAQGQPLHSDKRYVMHFSAEQLPPSRGFWSLTMYDERQLFSANDLQRFAIGDRDPLKFNPDGSLDLYIQREAPTKGLHTNWLPAPASGSFSMNMRLYWPKAAALDGRWTPPPVQPVQ
ncbi:DUF1254 domain-containing protein [Pseudomonas sp. 5P_3.1_Bac2]|uniref:DUF1254 domain-containing protein n=1 Tax=Pseudomonas sp. 5P_3.1_Bac2 TaxID=2971617 RepID=UPI0021C70E7F|nr:DUF1254 domain-containing protein [Pseudomonas sp. 5P_3.1_Bac2]MCU1715683.1 DUF1254 domain-containing protein [Pseudomonas sp. 5P_3.1_Bac2]